MSDRSPRLDRIAWTIAVLITLVAFFAQLYRLSDLLPVPTFDSATDGLDALRILRRGVTPIFLPANGGREPLSIYLQALSFWALGISNFALRLPGALAGALAVPVLFGLARSLLPSKDRPSPLLVPACAALGLALSVWEVGQTRLGLRVALLPLVSTAALWLFLDGWRKASLPRLAASGALLGLSAYTYTAARFLPFVIVIAALPELISRPTASRPSRSQRWLGFGMLALVALAVFGPLGWYYLNHPAMFAERAASVMIWNVQPPITGLALVKELGLNMWRTAIWFARFPLPISAGLLLGLGFALTRLRRLEYRLLAVWWLVMLLPTILTTENPHPMRALGAAPPTYLLTALGLAGLVEWLSHWRRIPSRALVAAVLLLVTLSGLPLWGYFHPTKPDPLSGTSALADALVAEAHKGVVYLPLSAYADPSLRFLLAGQFDSRADWATESLPEPSQLVQPVGNTDLSTLVRLTPDGWITPLPPLSQDGQVVLQQSSVNGQPIVDRYGTVVGYEITLADSADPVCHLVDAAIPANATVVGLADLLGYNLESAEIGTRLLHLVPGSPLCVTTFWQAYGSAKEDYDLIVHLVDDADRMWGRADGPPLQGAYSTSLWRPGEKVADGRPLEVGPEAPPGRYWLEVAFYNYPSDSRLPVISSPLPNTIRLGPLKIPVPPASESYPGITPQTALFGEVAQLLGYRLILQPNGVTFDLYWGAESPDENDYTVFVHILDAQGNMVKGQDSQPINGSYPTGIWESGEVILDEHTIDTVELSPGEYRLEIGMYLLETGERLPVLLPDGTEDPARRLVLDTRIQVP